MRLATNPRAGQIVEGERGNRKNKSRGKKKKKKRKEKHVKIIGDLLHIATSFHKKFQQVWSTESKDIAVSRLNPSRFRVRVGFRFLYTFSKTGITFAYGVRFGHSCARWKANDETHLFHLSHTTPSRAPKIGHLRPRIRVANFRFSFLAFISVFPSEFGVRLNCKVVDLVETFQTSIYKTYKTLIFHPLRLAVVYCLNWRAVYIARYSDFCALHRVNNLVPLQRSLSSWLASLLALGVRISFASIKSH